MSDVVTRLVIRADGALTTLDSFERGMEDAGKATDYTSGAVASFEKRMAAARQAMERGNAIATESVVRKSAEQRAWERWSATVDKTTALRIRLEREAMRASVDAANAVNLGLASQEQALATLTRLERQHTKQLSAHIAAENNIALAYNRTAQSAEQAAISTTRLAAANANRRDSGQNFNTANVAAQFQDIAVTAAMGMSPLQIALQQGTQLSAVLGGQGLTGVVKTLGAAFASIVSPVSLITLGVVTLAAWGIQAFMNMTGGAEDATSALEKHNAVLDETLAGYGAARQAAAAVLDGASRSPVASVASDLTVFRVDALERYDELLGRIRTEQSAWQDEINLMSQVAAPDELILQMQRVVDVVDEVGLSSATTIGQLDGLHASLTLVKNSGADEAAVAIAEGLLVMIEDARQGKAIVDSLGASLTSLDRDVQIRISVSQVFSDAMADINALYMDPRSRFDQARDELALRSEAAKNSAQTTSELEALSTNFDRVLNSINAAEAAANAKSVSRASANALKPFDRWDDDVTRYQQRIDAQEMELNLMGKSTFEVERQKAAFDLLNQAKDAGIPITAEVTDQINLMSTQYAAATDRLTQATQAFDFYKSTFSGFFADLKSGLRDGQSFWEAFGNAGVNALDKLADRALSMAANGIFDMLFGTVTSALGGGVTGGAWGNGLWGSAIFNAKGGIYSSPSLSAYSNGIYDRPHMFAFAQGAGIFGEAGPEAIMPLARTAGGDLGVRVANQNSAAANQNGRVQIEVSISVDEGGNIIPLVRQVAGQEADIRVSHYDRRTLPGRVNELKNNSMVVRG